MELENRTILDGALGLVLVLGVCSRSGAATITVDLAGSGDFTDIQSAIDAAADGDTVLVKRGEYVIAEPIDFNRLHDPDDPMSPPVKNIALKSEGGADATTIRMAETPADPERASVVIFESGEANASVLEGFTIAELAPALEYRLSLRSGSPCIGAGKHGTDMGAGLGVCEGGGPGERVVHMAAGGYSTCASAPWQKPSSACAPSRAPETSRNEPSRSTGRPSSTIQGALAAGGS